MTPFHYKIIFAALVVLGSVLYIFIAYGYFPVAIVNSSFITQREYEKNVAAVINYYDAAAKTYSKGDIKSSEKDILELKQLTLNEMIQNRLVHVELKKRLGRDLRGIVDKKLADAKNKEDFKKAATAIYGLEFSDFTDLVLTPVAEREVLEGRLFLASSTFEDWTRGAKQQARVIILISGFSWDGKGIMVK